MKMEINIEHLGKVDKKEEKDMYNISFKTYNAEINGKFERSEIRSMIETLDNAI
jgi:hypothetical protein